MSQNGQDKNPLDFDAEMEEFACHLLESARKTGVKLEDKIKAFEAVQPYHAAREKYKGVASGRSQKTRGTFGDFRAAANKEQ